MPDDRPQAVERALSPLPGWMFLLAGLVLVGAGILAPMAEQHRHMQWRGDLLSQQNVAMQRQAHAYRRFISAIDARDPIAVEWMAYAHLNLMPAHVGWALPADPIELPDDGHALLRVADGTPALPAPRPRDRSIERILHMAAPRAGIEIPAYEPLNTRLVRLTTQQTPRSIMLATGALLIGAGLFWRSGVEQSS